MNYDLFRIAWQEALVGSGLQIWSFANETVLLHNLSPAYRAYVSLSRLPPADAFNITAELSWEWDALLSSESAACSWCLGSCCPAGGAGEAR